MRDEIGSGLGGLALAGAVLALALSPGGASGASRGKVLPPRFRTPASALPLGGGTTSATTTTPTSPVATTPSAGATTPPAGVTTPSPGTTTPPAAATIPPAGATTPGVGATTPGALTGQAGRAGATGLPGQTRRTSAAGTSLSTGALVAVVLAGLLILLCGAWAVARWWAWEPHWMLTARHSFSEAGLRLSATWGEFSDWSRLGH